MLRLIMLFTLLLITTVVSGCKEEKSMAPLANLSDVDWSKINKVNLFFGHQSVGFDLLNGLALVKIKYPQLTLTVHEPNALNQGKSGIYQKQIGKNFDPKSKLADFFVDQSSMTTSNSVVAMKFCYVDIMQGTGVEELFADYQQRVSVLTQASPSKRILHFTAPLTSDERGLKPILKKLLGKHLRGYGDNVAREHYNRLLLQTYGSENVFDIAQAESTAANSERIESVYKGQHYYAMNPAYTRDGGHLNTYGKEYVATEFIRFLSTYL